MSDGSNALKGFVFSDGVERRPIWAQCQASARSFRNGQFKSCGMHTLIIVGESLHLSVEKTGVHDVRGRVKGQIEYL